MAFSLKSHCIFRDKAMVPFIFIVLGLQLHLICGCPLPLSGGDWYTSTRGTWTVSADGNTINNFKDDLSIAKISTLTCVSAGSTSTQYIVHTNFEIFVNVFIDVYSCIDIRTTTSEQRFLYYFVTTTDAATGEQFTSDQASACSNSGYDTARDAHMIISKSSPLNATQNCPDVILGNYSVNYAKTDRSQVTGSEMNSCNDTTLMQFSNSDTTLKHAFSGTNELYCIHSESSGSEVFIHTFYNGVEDPTNDVYNFACWVVAYTATGVDGSVYPGSCQQEQSSTAVQYGGQTYTFTPYFTCPLAEEPTEEFPVWAIVLIVLGGLLLLLVIVVIVAFLLYSRRGSHTTADDERGIINGEEKRQSTPDSLSEEKERMKKKDDGYDSGFDERWKTPVKQMICETEREHTMDLIEVPRDSKLKEADVTRMKEPLPGPSEKLKIKAKDEKTKVIPPKKKQEQEKIKQEELKQGKEKIKQEKLDQEKEKQLKKEQEKTKQLKIEKEKAKLAEQEKEKVETPEPVAPPGKKIIQPLTPRPAADDTTLARVKKETKKDKKEQGVRVAETIKEESEESSGEYETDESERKARMQRLLEKRKRLAEAEYQPPDLADATVVGRKKRRKQRELDEMTKKLVNRQKQEEMDKAIRERKKAIKRLARSKFKTSTDGEETTDTEIDTKGIKSKYRKVGDTKALEAPYIEQYCTKKYIEGELDAIDYWNPNRHSSPDFADDELEYDADKKVLPIVHVQPAEEGQTKTGAPVPRLDLIMQEEGHVFDTAKGVPLPGALGYVGVELGPNGEVPEGFWKDEKGNVIRIADGAMISSEDIARKLELRRRLIFSLPRLIRNTEGRPLGGYKDDEYGPTAEWDYGIVTDEDTEIDADRKGKSPDGATSATKQVGFADDRSVLSTPLLDGDENQRKGRHLTATERELLKKRLFEERKENSIPDSQVPVHGMLSSYERTSEYEQQMSQSKTRLGYHVEELKNAYTNTTVYFAGGKQGVKLDSIYIDNTQIQRPNDLKPVAFQRSISMRTPGRANMVMKSDAYDDGRAHMYRDGLGKDKKILQNANARRSLRQTHWTPREGIPEENTSNCLDTKRNLGSDDEFILVPGTLNKIPRPSELIDERLKAEVCPRYERHRYVPGREISDISMCTADTRPFSGDDRRLRQALGEFYKDKKYFEYYIDTEALPTNAAVETRNLATHGRDFLLDVAEYWGERLPPPQRPPLNDLSLRLSSRLPTTLTAADSGHDSMRSYTTDRPHTADDMQNMPVPPPRPHGNRPSRENTQDSARETLPTVRTQLSDITSRQSNMD